MTTSFNFVEKSVRVEMDENNNPLFLAKDICEILELNNVSQALSRLDDDEKGIILNDTLGGKQEMSVVNESGLYALILSSRKPEAKKFRKWVTNEVLPTIRKTGSYTAPNFVQPPPQQSVEKITRQQLDDINRMVHGIMYCCHQDNSANTAAYAGIREQYGLKSINDLPSIHFNTVYGMLNVIHEKAQQYLKLRVAIDSKFIKDVVKNHQFQLEITQQLLLPN